MGCLEWNYLRDLRHHWWSSLDLNEFRLGAVTTSSHRLFHRLVMRWRKKLARVLVLQRSFLSLWEWPLVMVLDHVLDSRCRGSCSVLYICCVWICRPRSCRHVLFGSRPSIGSVVSNVQISGLMCCGVIKHELLISNIDVSCFSVMYYGS